MYMNKGLGLHTVRVKLGFSFWFRVGVELNLGLGRTLKEMLDIGYSRSGQTFSQHLWASDHISLSTQCKIICLHLLPIHIHPACASMLLFTVIIQLLRVPTCGFTPLGQLQSVATKTINIQMDSCSQTQPHHLLQSHVLQRTVNNPQDNQHDDCSKWACTLQWVLFRIHSRGAYVLNPRCRQMISGTLLTTAWMSSIYETCMSTIPVWCSPTLRWGFLSTLPEHMLQLFRHVLPSALTVSLCVALLLCHTFTCTAAVTLGPTHPVEDMQV